MKRRDFLQASGLGETLLLSSPRSLPALISETPKPVQPAELDEVTIAELQQDMTSGKTTSQSITRKYLERINDIDKKGPTIKSVIEANPEAVAIAEALDRE